MEFIEMFAVVAMEADLLEVVPLLLLEHLEEEENRRHPRDAAGVDIGSEPSVSGIGDLQAHRLAGQVVPDQRRIKRDIVRPDFAADSLENLLDSKISGTANTDVSFTEKSLFSEDQAPDLRIYRTDEHRFISLHRCLFLYILTYWHGFCFMAGSESGLFPGAYRVVFVIFGMLFFPSLWTPANIEGLWVCGASPV
jgi:hypothetical protein